MKLACISKADASPFANILSWVEQIMKFPADIPIFVFSATNM
jgi:hypothetical protein